MYSQALQDIGSTILNYAVFLASVGAVVMALQEVFKSVFRLRLAFNRRQFDRWLGNDTGVRKEFLALTTGGYESEDALFDQPVEKMLGQIQSAATMALDFPDEYQRLYGFLTRIPGAEGKRPDQEIWKSFAAKKPDERAALSRDDSNDAAKARARLGNLVSRKLDAFQNQTQFAWADWNQRTSVLASAALIIAVLYQPMTSKFPAFGLPILFFLGLAGGAVAPFAKDVVSSLAQFGKGK